MACSRVHLCLLLLLGCALLTPDISAQRNHPCREFTLSKCPETHHDRTTAADEETCQHACDVVGYDYYVLHNSVTIQGCWLFHGSLHSYIKTCQLVAGPAEPSIEECLISSDECKVIYKDQKKQKIKSSNLIKEFSFSNSLNRISILVIQFIFRCFSKEPATMRETASTIHNTLCQRKNVRRNAAM